MTKPNCIHLSLIFLAIVGLLSLPAMASERQMQKVLNMKEAPDGVVFEIVEANEDALKTALDKFERYQKQLREKFPDIDLAIVTHGSEQFALTTDNQKQYAQTHRKVQRISTNTPVHICETHASWRNITAEDFPDYINVSPSGPSQIRQYQELGYVLVIL